MSVKAPRENVTAYVSSLSWAQTLIFKNGKAGGVNILEAKRTDTKAQWTSAFDWCKLGDSTHREGRNGYSIGRIVDALTGFSVSTDAGSSAASIKEDNQAVTRSTTSGRVRSTCARIVNDQGKPDHQTQLQCIENLTV